MKKPKPKACTVEMVDPEAPEYGLLKELIAVHHPHLANMEINLAWKRDWKEDKDGHLTRGHDVEDFTEIVGRYGLWKPDLRKFVESAQAARPGQLELFKDDKAGLEMTLTTSTAQGAQSVTFGKKQIDAVKRHLDGGKLNPFDT